MSFPRRSSSSEVGAASEEISLSVAVTKSYFSITDIGFKVTASSSWTLNRGDAKLDVTEETRSGDDAKFPDVTFDVDSFVFVETFVDEPFSDVTTLVVDSTFVVVSTIVFNVTFVDCAKFVESLSTDAVVDTNASAG